ncbi:multidrug resistance-associated protein 4-like [Centruroides sculpturatus]|uniref:multidrug resistance-associated protein 4-like n=1 Tax=Centruroides sculpturatus TaxID=218467 RepID=UPI000C6DBC03|nr:multidrug resistance-associated protein 4-like [Centruroides sculpturatus]
MEYFTFFRALYLDADIFLLDDPLSAVDVPVAKEIFEKCIIEYLKDKICILVTHQIQFLNFATKILVLNKGRCEAIGNYNELKYSGEYLGIKLEKNTSEQNMELPNANFTINEEETFYNKQVGTLYDNYDIINNDVVSNCC